MICYTRFVLTDRKDAPGGRSRFSFVAFFFKAQDEEAVITPNFSVASRAGLIAGSPFYTLHPKASDDATEARVRDEH